MKSKIADGGGSNDGSDGGSAGAAGNKRHRGTDDQARMEEVNISHKDPLPGCSAIASRAALLLSSSLSFSFSLSPSPSPSLSFDLLAVLLFAVYCLLSAATCHIYRIDP